jgi:superfamily II DNA or RNA helicase
MEFKKEAIGNNYLAYFPVVEVFPSADEVVCTWKQNAFNYVAETESTKGFRAAQLGAVFAVKSHWTISEKPATVVMPTGTGKTETMFAIIVSECRKRTLIIVPSNLLRQQTVERCLKLEKLREFNAISDKCLNPMIACLNSSPTNKDELKSIVERSNIIISTASLISGFADEYFDILSELCDTLIVDEAHHTPAKSWRRIKRKFADKLCIQFTATPFRDDGQKIDGKIIYNFPLSIAQKQGYFKPINFYPILEFDYEKKDLAIANKAVEILESDMSNNYPHLLLVRASTKKRAKELYDLYSYYFAKHNPVLIISGQKGNKKSIADAKNGKSRIIICVDMFGEGIDIPQLKICAIHDKYKSIPITIQFIGRFARSQGNLGNASVVANIADDDIEDALQELYSQDADWSELLKKISEDKISKEERLQELVRDFTGKEEIPIAQIRPKISMFMYYTDDDTWNWENWDTVFDPEHSHCCINQKAKILIVTERSISSVDWTTSKDIVDLTWQLHILYWNENKKVFFINTTDKGLADRFASAIFSTKKRKADEELFRCLSGVNRLKLATVGLKPKNGGHIRYQMYAGIDVETGLTEAQKANVRKSNLFGVGYEDGKDISIGCSYKGTVWAKWVETLDYWIEWCNKVADKILDSNISVEEILKGVLIQTVITNRPNAVPYGIDFPIELYLSNSYYLKTGVKEDCLLNFDITLTVENDSSPLTFLVSNGQMTEEFTLEVSDKYSDGFVVSHKSGDLIMLKDKEKELYLSEYFCENPPEIRFCDQSSLDGNLLTRAKVHQTQLSNENIIALEWDGVDIKKESQWQKGADAKANDSIQYKVISMLKSKNEYTIIFDDDGKGEIADVVAIIEDPTAIKFELYHCKFSGGDEAGFRIKDLYEVCGQAEKCVSWYPRIDKLIDRLIERERRRLSKPQGTRFEVGDGKILQSLKKKLKFFRSEFSVYIVQPGVDSKKITQPMHDVLCSASSYLKETYAIELRLICS